MASITEYNLIQLSLSDINYECNYCTEQDRTVDLLGLQASTSRIACTLLCGVVIYYLTDGAGLLVGLLGVSLVYPCELVCEAIIESEDPPEINPLDHSQDCSPLGALSLAHRKITCNKRCPDGRTCSSAPGTQDEVYKCKKVIISSMDSRGFRRPIETQRWELERELAPNCPSGYCYP